MRLLPPLSTAAALTVLCTAISAAAQQPSSKQAESSPGASAGSVLGTPTGPPGGGSDELTYQPHFYYDDGRIAPTPPSKNRLRFSLHGEYQMRFRALTDLALQPRERDPNSGQLGQNSYLYHWLRLKPRIDYRDKVSIIGELDAPRGLILGDTTQFVGPDLLPLDEEDGFQITARQLFIEYRSPIGTFRMGQQTSQWGMGIIANSGDSPTWFGDYERGNLVNRFLFATKPGGVDSNLIIALAGDIVASDNTADLSNGDRAFQGVGALLYKTEPAELGFYGVIRHQNTDTEATGARTIFNEDLTVGVFDLAGKFHSPVPGVPAYLFGAFEAALITGKTTYVRNTFVQPTDATATRDDEDVLSFGSAVKLGFVHVANDTEGSPTGRDQWGDFVAEVEYGYASGDADPNDGETRRFTFDTNHNVGLVLFDQVLRWKTARAAALAQDPELVARPAPGSQFLPSNGGVFGATYLNPRFIVRPQHWLDLKAGAIFAQTTADLVDPYQLNALGNARNYDGGDVRSHDLGIELDAGFDARVRVDRVTTFQIGAEGGVLLPGNAFNNAAGQRLDNQYVANIRFGVQY